VLVSLWQARDLQAVGWGKISIPCVTLLGVDRPSNPTEKGSNMESVDVDSTPQMLTLGRDASDIQRRFRSSAVEKPRGRGWLESITRTFSTREDETTDLPEYVSLEACSSSKLTTSVKSLGEGRFSTLQHQPDVAHLSRQVSEGDQQQIHRQNCRKLPNSRIKSKLTQGKEYESDKSSQENVQSDCGLFFGDLETHQHRHAWYPQQVQGVTNSSNSYSAAMISPPVYRHYHNKYLQLNRDLSPVGLIEPHDLHLESIHTPQQDEIIFTDTLNRSTLFYQMNGRTLMRLPRDQVRLLMGSEIESGVLSVEQCHSSEELDTSSQLYHLRYVLTVDDNLYRTIMSEMSDHLVEPFCGLRSCCLENEKVDIRIALVLLAATFFVLFITTIKWHFE